MKYEAAGPDTIAEPPEETVSARRQLGKNHLLAMGAAGAAALSLLTYAAESVPKPAAAEVVIVKTVSDSCPDPQPAEIAAVAALFDTPTPPPSIWASSDEPKQQAALSDKPRLITTTSRGRTYIYHAHSTPGSSYYGGEDISSGMTTHLADETEINLNMPASVEKIIFRCSDGG